MATLFEVVTGDDVLIPVQLKKGGNPFVISDTAEVKARLVSLDNTKPYCETVAQSKDTVGAAWATSLVVVSFPNLTMTDTKFQGEALLEIQVADTAKQTWFVRVKIRKGNI